MNHKHTIESFWQRVSVRSLDECWPWLGSCNNTGYGTVRWGRSYTAHRVAAWTLGLVDAPAAPTNKKGSGFIMHSCDYRICCNPTHWEIGTYAKNQSDAYARGRRAQPQGHKHANAKLTPRQVARIRTSELSQDKLAAKYMVSQACISSVILKRTYRWI